MKFESDLLRMKYAMFTLSELYKTNTMEYRWADQILRELEVPVLKNGLDGKRSRLFSRDMVLRKLRENT